MQLETFRVLSEEDVRSIHEASVDILENTGVKIFSPRLLRALQEKGLPVDEESRIVRFPRGVLEDALSRSPDKIAVHNRNGEHAFTLGEDPPRIAAGHNAVFWVDSETGETRPSTVADVEGFSRICEQLECIHMIGVPVMPQDVPDARATLPYGVRAVIQNSTKPIFFSTDSCRVNRCCIDLLEAAYGGDFRKEVYGITQLSPTSPLFWEEDVSEAILDTLSTNVPLAILPEPNAGISAPYTLAGLITVNNAECLSGLAMIQLLKPGHPVMYANSWTTTDMASGAALVGSTETSICRVAGAQLARFYNIPSHTTAPNSDNHAHDEQNAWEKTYSTFCAVGAGNDLIVNCGMFATGMTCSNEQLIMDEEISAMALRISEGVRVDQDTIAADVIRRIGPQGETYLTTEHTLQWLRSDEYLPTRVSVRGPRASWEASGAKDTYQLAREKAAALIGNQSPPVPDEKNRAMQGVIDAFMKQN